MRDHDIKAPRDVPSSTLGKRLLWFAALWIAGVGCVTALSYGLRLWIAPH